ncbi:hypothetical protein [Leptospira neocaledonica]|uniref:Replication-associated protein G2P N-terminal domain-containing protein n=1 Tax=Leptospira neocaledonica TaxID=2023192 RepID=A0A2M9ZZD9_9LEPT|nr:hypothetical protein [Leptospira neocaledonica]PJZ77432.1 hypothetical protein CH365_07550 [Leptospira neocaledonica]
MTFTSTLDPYSYLGIDTVHLFTPNNNLSFDSDIVKFRTYVKDGKNIVEYRTKYINIRFKEITERKREYWFYFSLAKLFSESNLYSDSPLGQEHLQEFLIQKLADIGITIKNWKKVKIGRLDIFQNVKLSSKYSEYIHLLKLLDVPRTSIVLKSNTVYHENKSWVLCAYDKREQLKLPVGEDEILRVELRFLKSQKIKNVFGTNLLLSVFDKIDDVFVKYIQQAFGFLGQIQCMSDIIPLDCQKIQEALTLYYSKTKKNKFLQTTEDTLNVMNIPFTSPKKTSSKRKPIVVGNKEAVRKTKQRSAKKEKLLKQTGVLALDLIQGYGGLAQELIEAFWDKKVRKSNFLL